MGLATMPCASEGLLCIILINTAVPFTLFRHIIRALLLIIGFQFDSDPGTDLQVANSYLLEDFRTQTPAVWFDSICKNKEEEEESSSECLVCLSKFEPESEINDLPCGHLFHKTCLEQWVDYWNITCPLCRTPFITHRCNS